jgi:hypothetical protein
MLSEKCEHFARGISGVGLIRPWQFNLQFSAVQNIGRYSKIVSIYFDTSFAYILLWIYTVQLNLHFIFLPHRDRREIEDSFWVTTCYGACKAVDNQRIIQSTPAIFFNP